MPGDVPVIETVHLAKSYGRARGIVDVSLRVDPGEVFGFIGPNGAGKSTTIRVLLGLLRRTSGEARVFGLDCERDRVRIATQVGYLPSEVRYYERMRSRDLLSYAASFYADPEACRRRARELAGRLGLPLDKRVADLSLGNRKKLGIVQALLNRPRLIILDEPTSGLDPLMQRTFFDLVREERERGATVLFSSHVLSEVQRVCDRVAIIREGRIVRTQSMAELAAGAVKRVSVELAGGVEADPAALARMGALHASCDGAHASFLFAGGANALARLLGKLDLADVEVAEPSLEEVFMRYYAEGAGGTAAEGGPAGGVSADDGLPEGDAGEGGPADGGTARDVLPGGGSGHADVAGSSPASARPVGRPGRRVAHFPSRPEA